MQELLEVLGALVLIAAGLVILYCLFQLIKRMFDWYIQTKLTELYDQKDRLWMGVNDAYDNYEELKEKIWDYEINKKKLDVLANDVIALEDYVLNDVQDLVEDNIRGVVSKYDFHDIKYGKYLYDKTRDEMCFVIGLSDNCVGNVLTVRYESDGYKKPVNVSVDNLKEFKKYFYLTVSQEPNAAGYVKEYIQKHLGIVS